MLSDTSCSSVKSSDEPLKDDSAHRHSSVSFWCLFIFNVTHYDSSIGGQCCLYWNSCSQAVIWKGAVPKMKASDHVLGWCLLRWGENYSPAPQRPFLCQVPHLLMPMLRSVGASRVQELEEAECNKNGAFAPRGGKTSGEKKLGKGRLLRSQVLLQDPIWG